jgi:flagellar biosynthesis anti-sigma factor FlgM
LQQLEKVLNDVSVVDGARVDAIKRAISEGRFNVSSDAVADKLLETVRAHLLSPRSSAPAA